MTFTELLAEVYTLTNRPDLTADSTTALRAATLKMHHSDFYFKDVQQAILTLQVADYTNIFDTSLCLRYRSMKFIRKWYPTGVNVQTQEATGSPGKFLAAKDVNEILDSYSRDSTDVYYIAGSSVNLRLADQLRTLLIGWYKHPSIDTANYVSWIAVDHPYAIVFEAVAMVFRMIGYDEQSSSYAKLAAEQLAMIRMSNIEMEGR